MTHAGGYFSLAVTITKLHHARLDLEMLKPYTLNSTTLLEGPKPLNPVQYSRVFIRRLGDRIPILSSLFRLLHPKL